MRRYSDSWTRTAWAFWCTTEAAVPAALLGVAIGAVTADAIAFAAAALGIAYGCWRGMGVHLVDEGAMLRVRNPWRTYLVDTGEVDAVVGRQPSILKGAVCPGLVLKGRRRPLTVCALACFGSFFSGATSARDLLIVGEVRQLAERLGVDATGFLAYFR